MRLAWTVVVIGTLLLVTALSLQDTGPILVDRGRVTRLTEALASPQEPDPYAYITIDGLRKYRVQYREPMPAVGAKVVLWREPDTWPVAQPLD